MNKHVLFGFGASDRLLLLAFSLAAGLTSVIVGQKVLSIEYTAITVSHCQRLNLQNIFFINQAHSSAAVSTTVAGGVAAFAAFELFVARDLSSVTVPLIALPLLLLVLSGRKPHWLRRYLDAVGIYVVVRMLIQLFGLNLLVLTPSPPDSL